ncbi:hypothetical protein FRC20_011458 [Serendipita sp. 405]|nr:hypothetical protein FRC15_011349 [Serendipita sp. 397]KAG8861506.1 hypothetical protein FRC20_011458 [Serendipita sp. 405]
MAHAGSQVPYDPLVAQDHDDEHSSHHNTLHSHLNTNTYPPSHSSSSLPPGAYLPPVGPPTGGTITYNTPYRDTPSPAPHQSTEFGAPTPGFFYTDQPGTRASYASGPSIASRGSAYGSIAPLHNDRADGGFWSLYQAAARSIIRKGQPIRGSSRKIKAKGETLDLRRHLRIDRSRRRPRPLVPLRLQEEEPFGEWQ